MTNNTEPNNPNADIEASRMYTQHGAKRKQGHPVKIYGKNALAYCEGGKVTGFTFQDEINEMFNRPDIPEYNPI